jgi:tyrosinase
VTPDKKGDAPVSEKVFELGRRELLASAGVLGLTLATGGCEQLLEAIAHRPTRRNIANLAPNDPILQNYRAAISAMKALPNSDQRNWMNQADIHFNHCSHGNWFILPWHRPYLLYFERICQKLSGNAQFAIPYWNWAEHPTVPDVFYASGDILNDTTKTLPQGTPIAAEFVSHSVLEGILEETNFQVFGSYKSTTQQGPGGTGRIEGTPHNNVHTSIGGHMGAFHSPLDPIFWTHHAMLDFCWVDWNFNRQNQNPNDPTWYNLHFTDFVDENNNPVDVSVAITQLFPIFSYQYEPSQIGTSIAQLQVRTQAEADALKAFVQRGGNAEIPIQARFPFAQPTAVTVGRAAPVQLKVERGVLERALAAAGTGRVLLTLQQVEPPAAADFFVRVFVNAPGPVSADTPISDPHYAGSFAFFLDATAHQAMAMGRPGFVVDVSETLRRIGPTDKLTLQFVAVPYPGRVVQARSFSISGLELAVTQPQNLPS